MCKWGTDIMLRVPMPADLSYTGEFRWADKPVDACIAPLVQALNDAEIYTANCCCGHGKAAGEIILHDGRVLIVVDTLEEADAMVAYAHARRVGSAYPPVKPQPLRVRLWRAPRYFLKVYRETRRQSPCSRRVWLVLAFDETRSMLFPRSYSRP